MIAYILLILFIAKEFLFHFMFIEKSNNAAIVIKQCIIMILSKILQVRIIEFQLIISIC